MIIVKELGFLIDFDEIRLIRRIFARNERIWQKKVLLCPVNRDIKH